MSCTRRWFRRAGFLPQASSTSTSATFPTRRWRRHSRAWSVRSWSRAKPRWTIGATPFARRWGRMANSWSISSRKSNSSSANNHPCQNCRRRKRAGRFQLVFRRFLGVFARPEHPLALFLDDLQWLDAATLELLEHLVTDPDVRHVLLIGAYRDNEVGSCSSADADAGRDPRRGSEAAGHRAGASRARRRGASDRRLPSLRAGAPPVRWRSWSTRRPAAIRSSRSSSSRRWTRKACSRSSQDAATWRWDLDRIHAKGYTDNVVDLMVGKLSRFPHATQESLSSSLPASGTAPSSQLLRMVYRTIRKTRCTITSGKPFAHGPHFSLRDFLSLPPRPSPGSSLLSDSGATARSDPFAHRQNSRGEHPARAAGRSDLRHRQSTQPWLTSHH